MKYKKLSSKMKLKRLFIFILIIILLGLLAYYYPNIESLATGKSISNANQEYPREPATVIRVVDGDTIETDLGTIRLLGINTPKV